jgi:hypothetical protein
MRRIADRQLWAASRPAALRLGSSDADLQARRAHRLDMTQSSRLVAARGNWWVKALLRHSGLSETFQEHAEGRRVSEWKRALHRGYGQSGREREQLGEGSSRLVHPVELAAGSDHEPIGQVPVGIEADRTPAEFDGLLGTAAQQMGVTDRAQIEEQAWVEGAESNRLQ